MKDPASREVLLSVSHVDIVFGKGKNVRRVVRDATFEIHKGEIFSLVGESGSGKTTLGRAVIRVNPCAAGEILYQGKPLSGNISRNRERELIRKIQMVFQDPTASLNERATVEEILSEGLRNFRLYKTEEERLRKVQSILEAVGLLPEHLHRYPHEFSGGQRQRIAFARAMVMEPELVVADEPISALDVSVRAQVLNLMNDFRRKHQVSFLFIAHDLSVVRFISQRIGVIYQGNIVEIAPAEELFRFPLHPYTRALISAAPIPDPLLERRKVLLTYDPTCHPGGKASLQNIGHDHYVYGTKQELDEYHRLRETKDHIPSITLREER